jgi:3-phosphoshikimate 1-carboxyvinyltransferase
MILITSPPEKLEGSISMPGDKSISHRAAIIGALARGTTEIEGFLEAGDCLSTVRCLRALGVELEFIEEKLIIRGRGRQLSPPVDEPELDAGNSGTTARLLMGVLAGQSFSAVLTGDSSLKGRPMRRVVEPLRQMGAVIQGDGSRLPLVIRGGVLKPIDYKIPVASAQVKTALLLAGLYADGETAVEEPCPSRNHTELMLAQFGAPVTVQGNRISIRGDANLVGCRVQVPGDISAAVFFLVAGSIVPGAEVLLLNVGLNPTRGGIIDLLKEMGADIQVQNRRLWGREPVADLLVKGGVPLRGVSAGGALIPNIIDEIPVLAVAAAFAQGETVIRDAGELRVKESDRIAALACELSKMGVSVEELPDGIRIRGGNPVTGAVVESHGDHRIAMALAVAGLAARGDTAIRNAEAMNISFPGFINTLRQLVL